MERLENNMQLLKKEQGATSIFVMILMVVLIVFGLAALTTSLASLKLSNKNSLWTKEYYLLESKAEEYVAKIDQRLIKAEKVARDVATAKDQFNNEYYNNVLTNIQKLAEEVNDIEVYIEDAHFEEWIAEGSKSINLSFIVKESKEAYPKNITVDMEILLPDYDVLTNMNQSRFKINRWQEWQNAFEYDQDINFENPNFENPEFEDLE